MTTALIIVLLVLGFIAVARLVRRAVASDGYGRTRPPVSHHDWSAPARLV